MLLKGWTLKSESIEFKLSDGPILVSDTVIALVAEENTPLIKATTVVRGEEGTRVFEGDRVYQDNEYIGLVVYNGGFRVQLQDSVQLKLSELKHIEVRDGDIQSQKEVNKCKDRTKLEFKYNDSVVTLAQFMNVKGDNMMICNHPCPAKIGELLFYTGLRDGTRGIYYGELFRGGVVVCHSFEPSILRNGEFTLLEEEIKK